MRVLNQYNIPNESSKFITYNDFPLSENPLHLEQTHSNTIVTLEQIKKSSERVKADGILAKKSELKKENLSIAVKTADCLPILLISEHYVSLIHAGWRGIHTKILQNGLLQNLDIKFAYIGPSIQKDHFEVQSDFKKNFSQKNLYHEQEGKLFFDLQKAAKQQLMESYPEIKIIDSKICTFTENNYNSYRRNKTSKRNWNVFKI